MVRSSLLLMIIAGLVCLNGCKSQDTTKAVRENQDPRLTETISKCITATGLKEMEQWQFDADAIATIYENEGKTLVAQKHFFNCDQDKFNLQICSRGNNEITQELSEKEQLFSNGCLCPNSSKACIAARMKIYTIAISSLKPLLTNDELEIKYLKKEKKGGLYSHVLHASGNILACCRKGQKIENECPDNMTIWIDDDTGYISRIWVKYLKNCETEEYGYISAHISNYQRHRNGISLPMSIEYVPSNSKAGESNRAALKIDMQRIKFENDDIVISSNI